jgi:glycosyltransferase involved in cell wall biosynthesis
LYEGFGFPPLEAMACGTPVLSSSRGSLPEILGDAALYFDPHEKESFHRKLTEILGSSMLQKELTLRGYEQIKKYSFERMAKETFALYKKSTENKE